MPKPEELGLEKGKGEIERVREKVETPGEKIETKKELNEFSHRIIEKIERTSEETIESGRKQIESGVESTEGGPEDIKKGKEIISEVQREIKNLLSESEDNIKKTLSEEPEKKVEIKDRDLIEALRKNFSEPIPRAKDMPIYPFKDLMEKFKTTDLKTIVESKEYKKMVSEGFILGSGEERVYYGEKPGRTSEGEPTNVHLGVDYMVKEGTEITAVADGRIVDVESVKAPRVGPKHLYKGEKGYGNMVLLKHKLENGDVVYSLYGHLGYSKKHLKKGDIVKKGQIIGKVGKSFSVENGGWPSHLHFSILKKREAVAGYGAKKDTEKIIDPIEVFKKEKKEKPKEIKKEKKETGKKEAKEQRKEKR